MAVPKLATIFVVFFLLLAVAAAAETTATATATCVPTMQRMLSCLDFIEHRTDAVPAPCCAQLNATVAEQPCCLMHVLRGNVARLVGPGFDTVRAMVNVTNACLGDASALISVSRSCAGKPLPPLTPEYPFTAGLPPPQMSGATRLMGASNTSPVFALVALTVAMLRI
ncbi:non-specific lipid-transfer protein C6-like [Oryza brachyantha]|uniref:non-specific lipid-transfer protein C6-like n=1 Tax=Oryza brachyantha TaxID=4533 RepID=UPI001ADB34B3|nr:non-specific lipid-transfer protein C6-like [Oryza brachyantha]